MLGKIRDEVAFTTHVGENAGHWVRFDITALFTCTEQDSREMLRDQND